MSDGASSDDEFCPGGVGGSSDDESDVVIVTYATYLP